MTIGLGTVGFVGTAVGTVGFVGTVVGSLGFLGSLDFLGTAVGTVGTVAGSLGFLGTAVGTVGTVAGTVGTIAGTVGTVSGCKMIVFTDVLTKPLVSDTTVPLVTLYVTTCDSPGTNVVHLVTADGVSLSKVAGLEAIVTLADGGATWSVTNGEMFVTGNCWTIGVTFVTGDGVTCDSVTVDGFTWDGFNWDVWKKAWAPFITFIFP
jgi:hypothetical protein